MTLSNFLSILFYPVSIFEEWHILGLDNSRQGKQHDRHKLKLQRWHQAVKTEDERALEYSLYFSLKLTVASPTNQILQTCLIFTSFKKLSPNRALTFRNYVGKGVVFV